MCSSIDVRLQDYTTYFDNLFQFKHKTNESYNNIKNFIVIGVSYISLDNIFKSIRYVKHKCINSHPIL